jgi:hypothetical protein
MSISTAIYPNRIRDKEELEAHAGLPEFQDNGPLFVFFLRRLLFAVGYSRVVYGDHGPYIEFERKHILCPMRSKFGRMPEELPPEDSVAFYYFWLEACDSPGSKIYWQIKPVSDRPNAPKRDDGRPSAFNREEGYADYKRGFYYVNPYDLEIRRLAQ